MKAGVLVGVLLCLLVGMAYAVPTQPLMALDLKCDECKILVDLLGEAATDGLEGSVTKLATYLCYAVLKVEDRNVCDGVVPEFAKELFQVIDAGIVLESDLICWGFFKACPKPANIPQWNVTFPKPKPPYVPPVYPIKGSPSYQVMQMTDLHYDRLYAAGSYVHCGEPVCCRPTSPYHGDNATARPWGEYSCDLAPQMLDAFLTQAVATTPAKIVLWTGDTPPHFLWTQTQQSIINDTRMVSQRIQQALPKGVYVVPSIGNHEGYPVNNFGPPPLNKWLYDSLASDWAPWMPSDAIESLRNYGYFAMTFPPPLPGAKPLKVISLQTNYCNTMAFWLYLNDTDPGNQLHWLIDQLQASEDAGEAVWISGHIAPSSGSCRVEWADRLVEIINRYEMTVVGQFYGHTHMDSFVVDFVDGRPSTVQYICPSVTTSTDINPSWRIYDVDTKSHQIIDYSQWHFNLSYTYEMKLTQPTPVLYYT